MDNGDIGRYTFAEAAAFSILFLYTAVTHIGEMAASEEAITASGAALLSIGALSIASTRLIGDRADSVKYGMVAHGITLGVALMTIQYTQMIGTPAYTAFMVALGLLSLYLLIILRKNNPDA